MICNFTQTCRVFPRIGRRGCDRLGEPNPVRADISGVCRGDCIALGDVVEAKQHDHPLESIGWADGHSCVITVVSMLWQVFRSGPVTAMRVQGALAAYLCLGFAWAYAYRIAALLGSRRFHLQRRERCLAPGNLDQLQFWNADNRRLSGNPPGPPGCTQSWLRRGSDRAALFGGVSGPVGFDAGKRRPDRAS